MPNPLALLAAAGRHGPALLASGSCVGLALPMLAEAVKPLMGLAVFVFTLGAFLKVDRAAFGAEFATPTTLAAILLWTSFGVPLVGGLLLLAAAPPHDVTVGVMLYLLAPPVGSAAAIAAMLGLSAPLALLTTVSATILAAFYLPPIAAAVTGVVLVIDPVEMALRLAAIIGGASAAAWALRRFTPRLIAENPEAMTGLAVLGLIAVAIGATAGLRPLIFDDPARALALFGLAVALNLGFQVLGAVLFLWLGRLRALTVGLASGNRNLTLVWAAAAPFLAGQPGIELVLAMAIFPIFLLPAPIGVLMPRLLRGAAPSRPSEA